MNRKVFCYEEELLRRFASCEFGAHIDWHRTGLTDDMWGQGISLNCHPSKRSVNINFRTEYSQCEPSTKNLTKVAQIHPGYLNPAIFVSIDATFHEVRSLELMNGEATRLGDYPIAVSRIEAIADSVARQNGFSANLRWWRLFAMFDRILFLALTTDYSQATTASREIYRLPNGLNGECVALFKEQELIGLDGWFEQCTGFGADARV